MRHKLCRLLHVFIMRYMPITGLNYIWKIVKFTLNRHFHVYDWKGRQVHKPTPFPTACLKLARPNKTSPHNSVSVLHHGYTAKGPSFTASIQQAAQTSTRHCQRTPTVGLGWIVHSIQITAFPHTNWNEQQYLFLSVPHKCYWRANECIRIIIAI